VRWFNPVFLALPSFGLRFVDCDMVIHYHWGHGVGHTYAAFSADFNVADVLLPAETEQEENNTSRREVDLEDEDGFLGEDDMVYQNDSDDSMSEGGDIYDEACMIKSYQ
jgi:hypothetical protein